jgi:N-acetylmuramoyl-L-alanine amidase
VKARPGLYVLRKTRMPATLIELGFITNPRDAALMRDEPERFAQGMYRGIVDYVG